VPILASRSGAPDLFELIPRYYSFSPFFMPEPECYAFFSPSLYIPSSSSCVAPQHLSQSTFFFSFTIILIFISSHIGLARVKNISIKVSLEKLRYMDQIYRQRRNLIGNVRPICTSCMRPAFLITICPLYLGSWINIFDRRSLNVKKTWILVDALTPHDNIKLSDGRGKGV